MTRYVPVRRHLRHAVTGTHEVTAHFRAVGRAVAAMDLLTLRNDVEDPTTALMRADPLPLFARLDLTPRTD